MIELVNVKLADVSGAEMEVQADRTILRNCGDEVECVLAEE